MGAQVYPQLSIVLDWFGPRALTVPPLEDVLDWFGPSPQKQKPEALTLAPDAELPPTLGIDLSKRGHEVRKLLFAGFGTRMARSGYDPEDVLQEVYRGILARNVGKCPFDVRKSSFGHYVHLVITCILNNYHRKMSRQREIEQTGMNAPASLSESAYGGQIDASEVAARVLASTDQESEEPTFIRFQAHLSRKASQGLTVDPIAFQVARLLYEGHNQKDIAEKMGVRHGQVLRAIQSLREHAADWV